MKKTILLVATFLITGVVTQAQINPKNLGSKVVDKAKDAKDNKDSKTTDTKSTDSKSNADIKSSDTGPDLFAKGEKAFEAEKWKEALEYYEAAEGKGYMDGMMKVKMNQCRDNMASSPEDEEKSRKIGSMMAGLDAMKYKCDNVPAGNGTSSATHTKNVKKIVFSKTEIVKGSENEAAFTNSFNLSDNIYSRVYLEKSIGHEAASIGDCFGKNYFIRYSFDNGATKLPDWLNVNVYNTLMGSEGSVDNWTTWQPAISPSTEDLNFDILSIKNYVKYIRYLPAGTHKIKMEVVYDIPEDEQPAGSRYEENCRKYTTKFGAEKVLASGEFTITFTEADKRALYKKVCPLYKKEIETYNRSEYSLVSNAKALVTSATSVDWSKFTLLRLAEFGDWKYEKNYYGVILSRKSFAGAFLLNKEDNFIYYSSVEFYQENISSGGDKYGSTKVSVEAQNIEYVRGQDSFCKECIGK